MVVSVKLSFIYFVFITHTYIWKNDRLRKSVKILKNKCKSG